MNAKRKPVQVEKQPIAVATATKVAEDIFATANSVTNSVMQRAIIEMGKHGIAAGFGRDHTKVREVIMAVVVSNLAELVREQVEAKSR